MNPPLMLLDEATSALDAESERAVQQALVVRRLAAAGFGEGSSVVATTDTNLALGHKRQGDCESAVPLFERALAGKTANLGGEHIQLVVTLDGLSSCLTKIGRAARGEELARRSASIRGRVLGEDHVDLAISWVNLAEAQIGLGDHSAARQSLSRARERSRSGPAVFLHPSGERRR